MSAILKALPHPMTTAAPHADEEPLDLVFIEGFVGQTVIGIHDSELHRPQPLVIDLYAGIPRPRACDTDRIGDTIDYGEVRLRLRRLLTEHRVTLLEAFAEQIAHIVLNEFRARWVRIRVAKPRKYEDVEAVGVVIERRNTRTPVAAGGGTAMLRLLGTGMVPGER